MDCKSLCNMAKDLSTGAPWKLKSCLAVGSEASLPRQGTPGLLLRGCSSEGRCRVLEPFGVALPCRVPAFQGGQGVGTMMTTQSSNGICISATETQSRCVIVSAKTGFGVGQNGGGIPRSTLSCISHLTTPFSLLPCLQTLGFETHLSLWVIKPYVPRTL